ncbi:MAG: toll/interleukin-1 receptor domain-containing protein [Acetobacter fabarum]|jgi:hypothetical protein|nr:toll/interleukin-1 receptor domain-containing protein [Acetobacter fabarum]
MKVFLSWSGEQSKKVAQLLNDWLPRVIQSLEPWISTQDIQKGSLWSEVIGDQLQGMTTGIICLTMENKERPWILFEAGALAKGLTTNRVCTLLIDLEPADITPPLSQFNHTIPSMKEDVLHLLQTLNDRIKDNKIRSEILVNALDVHWPYFSQELQNIKQSTQSAEKVPPRSDDDILREILDNTRSLTNRISLLESAQLNSNNINITADLPEKTKVFPSEYFKARNVVNGMKVRGYSRAQAEIALKKKYPELPKFIQHNILNENFQE